jgi:hypothetical protein
MRSAATNTTAEVLSTKIFARVLMLCELSAILGSNEVDGRRTRGKAVVASRG